MGAMPRPENDFAGEKGEARPFRIVDCSSVFELGFRALGSVGSKVVGHIGLCSKGVEIAFDAKAAEDIYAGDCSEPSKFIVVSSMSSNRLELAGVALGMKNSKSLSCRISMFSMSRITGEP